MSAGPFEDYLRHGRRFGVGPEFWQAAAGDLTGGELRRLAAELDAKLPAKWATARNRPSDPASQAGLAANSSRTRPDHRTPESVSSGALNRACRIDGKALGPMNTSGLCRRCYQRELMHQRRAASVSS